LGAGAGMDTDTGMDVAVDVEACNLQQVGA